MNQTPKVNLKDGTSPSLIQFHYFGKDPIKPKVATTELDVFATLLFAENKEKGTLQIAGDVTGDIFPSTEAFIVDQSGNQKLYLGAVKESGGLKDLFGEYQEGLFKINITVLFNENGNFTGVK